MSLTYPLTFPTATGIQSRDMQPQTIVGMVQSPFTGQQQVYGWPGQWLTFSVSLPPMTDANAGQWSAFFMAMNGPEGTCLFGDSVRKIPRGTAAGTWTVGAGNTANSTTLVLVAGTGQFDVGDWLQIFSGASSRLHRVIQVNSATNYDVFPRLRSAYSNGSAVTYVNPKGVFRIASIPSEGFSAEKICGGMTINLVESL